MRTVSRVLLLGLISISGIALLAPLAARSAVSSPTVSIDHLLLPQADAPSSAAERSLLSARSARAELPSLQSSEAVEAVPIPTPATVAMEATLHVIATPKPAPVAPAPQRVVTFDGGTVWDQLAQCESGGNWAINTGNGYYGGLQFNLATWQSYGGGEFAAYPHEATREQQIIVAERLHAARGFQPWPACRVKLGLP